MRMTTLVEIMSFATIPCVTKCRLWLEMIAYVTIFQMWIDFGLPFN
jgi:hypothetical protein